MSSLSIACREKGPAFTLLFISIHRFPQSSIVPLPPLIILTCSISPHSHSLSPEQLATGYKANSAASTCSSSLLLFFTNISPTSVAFVFHHGGHAVRIQGEHLHCRLYLFLSSSTNVSFLQPNGLHSRPLSLLATRVLLHSYRCCLPSLLSRHYKPLCQLNVPTSQQPSLGRLGQTETARKEAP